MAPKEDWTLHRASGAPILNPYIDYVEKVLKQLEDCLGDKNAKTSTPKLTPGELAKNEGERLGESALKTEYDLKDDQISEYQDDWYALDDQIGFIASFAAVDANTVSREFEELRDAAIEISSGVPDNPTPSRQIDAVNALDNAVGEAYEAILRAFAKLEGKSTEVPRQDWSSSGGPAPYVPGLVDTGSAYQDASPAPIGQGVKADMQAMYERLINEHNFTPWQAAAILGNLQQESGFDTGAYNAGEGSIGLAQWRGGRRANLEAFAAQQGKPVTDWEVQIDFVVQEMRGTSGPGASTEKAAYDKFSSAGSVEAAAAAFDTHYERSDQSGPRGQEQHLQRIANARGILASGT